MTKEEIVKLAYQNINQLKAYIYSLCANWSAVDDIMQETLMSLMKSAAKYDQSRDFLSWALTIARRRTIDFQRRQGREPLIFTDEIYDHLEAEFIDQEKNLTQNQTIHFLHDCLKELSLENQRIMEMKYFQKMKVTQIGKKLGRSFLSVQSLLDRLRQKLKKCVARKLAES